MPRAVLASLAVAVALCVAPALAAADKVDGKPNLASFGAGALIVAEPKAYDDGWSGFWLLGPRQRAAAVKAYLVTAGIAADRLATAGFGATKPVSTNETALGRSQNRRVEVVKQ